jgi:lysosomal-associated membrane protein 1/2
MLTFVCKKLGFIIVRNNSPQQQVGSKDSLLCKDERKQTLNNSKGHEAVLMIEDFQVQPFYFDGKTNKFSEATECSADDSTNNIVPIAVGSALAALVLIVLIAYLIGRKRNQQSGYQSV